VSIWIDGQRVESIGPAEAIKPEDIIEMLEKMKESYESDYIGNYWICYMTEESAHILGWLDQEWYEGSGLYQMYGDDGHPVFINDGMMPMVEEIKPIEFTVFDEVGTFDPPSTFIKDGPQSGKDKSDFFNKKKRNRNK